MGPAVGRGRLIQREFDAFLDRGGTFTDGVVWDGERLAIAKVLSGPRSPAAAIRAATGLPAGSDLPNCNVRIGTTIATNALLERRGSAIGLVTTKGFADLLAIGDQSRPDLFALAIERPAPLPVDTVGIGGRIGSDGGELEPLDEAEVRAAITRLRGAGVAGVAVALLNAYRSGDHERRVAAIAREMGIAHVLLSHEVAGREGYLARTSTTVVDGYVSPLLARHLDGLRAEIRGQLWAMQSNGGLTPETQFRGRNALLSGPAGGVVAVAEIARLAGFDRAIGLDMGGTSADVSRVDASARALELTFETQIAGARVLAPAVAVHTVAAGGGSICRVRGDRLTVGPDSAGASPGPLCYGASDATAVALTDANVVLGRVQPRGFPIPLDVERSRAGLAAMTDQPIERLAEAFFRIACETMATAIRRVTVARGHDPRDHALVAFGGAGGQHGCAIARALGIRHVIFPPLGGVLSALGIGLAPERWHGEQAPDRLGGPRPRLEEAALDTPSVDAAFASLEAEATAALGEDLTLARRIELRYRGSDTSFVVALEGSALEASPGRQDAAAIRTRFEAEHRRELGWKRIDHPIEVVALRLDATRPSPIALDRLLSNLPGRDAAPTSARLYVDGAYRDVHCIDRDCLAPGDIVRGPAIIRDDGATWIVEPGFDLEARPYGILVAIDRGAQRDEVALDAMSLEIFGGLFMSIAEEMGTVLRRSALSTNIRDRLDFSCAVFDREGGLIANAPHIPVHLGAMSASIRAVRDAFTDVRAGELFATNDPYAGGSHLPDVTVVAPIHDDRGTLRFWTAVRAHHADIGGATPGSMPAESRTLDEEGVVIPPMRIGDADGLDEARVRAVLLGARFPARRPDENVGDLRAQVEALRRGERLLAEAATRFGHEVLARAVDALYESAAREVEEALRAIGDREGSWQDALDDGTPIAVHVRVHDGRLAIDFDGTGPENDGNLHAPPAVTLAAVLYVVRCLVVAAIPLNAGCLRPVSLSIPERSILSPSPGRAVAGGNVETSQRVVDVLLAALDRAAASQGTMNNLSLGDASFGYYETLGGGAGALPDHDGASAVHTHMTNSRLTDVETLEARFPVRATELSIRRGSGGTGAHRGGDGLVRELELLAPLEVSILSQRRSRAPFGLHGGDPGAPGRNWVGGREVGSVARVTVRAGERVRIETPGGGGWGAPK